MVNFWFHRVRYGTFPNLEMRVPPSHLLAVVLSFALAKPIEEF